MKPYKYTYADTSYRSIGTFSTASIASLNWSHNSERKIWQATKGEFLYQIETLTKGYQLIVASDENRSVSNIERSLCRLQQKAGIHADTFA